MSERSPLRIAWGDLSDSLFDHLFSIPDPFPFVIFGATDKLQYQWTPEFFCNIVGKQPCVIQNCEDETFRNGTAGEFFQKYGTNPQPVERLRVRFKISQLRLPQVKP